jgi:hypothetical protein
MMVGLPENQFLDVVGTAYHLRRERITDGLRWTTKRNLSDNSQSFIGVLFSSIKISITSSRRLLTVIAVRFVRKATLPLLPHRDISMVIIIVNQH